MKLTGSAADPDMPISASHNNKLLTPHRQDIINTLLIITLFGSDTLICDGGIPVN